MIQLLSSLGKQGNALGLDHADVDFEDTKPSSKFFDITEFTPVFTAGKNAVSFNASIYLAEGSQILVECLDGGGNSLYIEVPDPNAHYKDVGKFTLSISVFADTISGLGKLIFVGTTTDNQIVRWSANITINNSLQNTSRTRFYNTPSMTVDSLLFPVINSITGSSLSGTSNLNTIASASFEPRVGIIVQTSTDVFTSQMVGQSFIIKYDKVFVTFGEGEPTRTIIPNQFFSTNTGTHVIQKVINSREAVIGIFNYKYVYAPNQFTIAIGVGFYGKIGINSIQTSFFPTSSGAGPYQNYTASNGSASIVLKSYANVVYENIGTFSGFVARHKLYAKSNIYPGDFVLVDDRPIVSSELLTDPITTNKSYSSIGTFSNQYQINQYWFSSASSSLVISQSGTPLLNSMVISTYPDYSGADGNNYVIAKTSAVGLINDNVYYPYNKTDFDNLSGVGYTSNFLPLKKGALYQISTNLIVKKDANNKNAKVSFYFTSSTPEIVQEKSFQPQKGLLLGEILIPDNVATRTFSDVQTIYFTPLNDYYGTLLIIPYQCSPTLANLSFQNYGDFGYSPGAALIRIPFPINIANEAFTIKSELYDINSNLIFSLPETVQLFDPLGKSLYGSSILGSNQSPQFPTEVPTLTIDGGLYLPAVPTCVGNSNSRILGINLLTGLVCATNIISIGMVSSPSSNLYKDYIEVNTSNPTLSGRSLIIHYSGSISEGKRIYIAPNGTKTIFQ